MPYSGQINFSTLNAAAQGYVPEVRVFLQEIGADGRSGSRLIQVSGFSNVTIQRGINAKGRATITFQNIDDRVFQGGAATSVTTRKYSYTNQTLTRKAISDALSKALPYVKEINPLRRSIGADRAFQGTATLGDRINSYLDFVYNFTATQGVALRVGNMTNTGVRFVDLLTVGLMQRVFIDVVGQDGKVYAGFSGIVTSVTDDYSPGAAPTVTLNCFDYWRLFEVAEIIVKQGPGVNDPAQGSPEIRDTIFFDIQSRLGLNNDDYRASPFDKRPGQLILLDVMRITQDGLCFIPNLQLRTQTNAVIQAINTLTLGVFSDAQTLTPDSSTGASPTVTQVDIVQDANFVETRQLFYADDAFWYLPDEKDFTGNYDGHTNLRRVAPGVTLTRAIDGLGNDVLDSRGQKVDRLLYVDPHRALGEGIRDKDLVGNMTGTLFVDKFMQVGVQAIVYQQLVQSILGPWQVQYATAMSILKKLVDATFYDMYFTGNGDLVYQVPRYNNFPGEYDASLTKTNRRLTTADKASKTGTADATSNPEGGGDPRQTSQQLVDNPSSTKSSAEKMQAVIDNVNKGKTTITDGTAQRAKLDKAVAVEASAIPADKSQGQKAGQQADASAFNMTSFEFVEIATDYNNLENVGLYDYAPDPRYPIKYHGFNYVISDLGLRRWSLTMSEEPLITAMRVPGGDNLLTNINGVMQHAFLTGRTHLTDTLKLQQRFGVRARTTQQMFIPNLYSNIGNATILLDAFAGGLLQQVNGLGDGGTLLTSSRPDLELGHNVMIAERQKLYYLTGINFNWQIGKDANSSFTLAYGHDFAEEIPNPWARVNLGDLVNPSVPSATAKDIANITVGVTPANPTASRGKVARGDDQNRTYIDRGTAATWIGYTWPVPNMLYRGVAQYSNSRQSQEFHRVNSSVFHYGNDVMFNRRDKEPKFANNGAKGFFCPNGVPIHSVASGKVEFVFFDSTYGWSCSVDHGFVKGVGFVHSFYQHMTFYNSITNPTPNPAGGQSAGRSDMVPFVHAGQDISSGDTIGFVGRDPSSNNSLVHLHFELWIRGDHGKVNRATDAVDPAPIMDLWGRLTDTRNLDGPQFVTNNGSPPNPEPGTFV